jgi:hypothetical protein
LDLSEGIQVKLLEIDKKLAFMNIMDSWVANLTNVQDFKSDLDHIIWEYCEFYPSRVEYRIKLIKKYRSLYEKL